MRVKPEGSGSKQAKTPQSGEANVPRSIERVLAEVRPRLHAIALRMLGDADEAEDAVQDALIKLWRNLGRFEGRSAFSTWVHRIAVNAALDRLRRRRGAHGERHEDREDDDGAGALQRAVDTPERLYGRAEAGFVVRQALGRLSPVQGEALRLCDLEGESYARIAAATRCPIGTVMSRIHHARRKLERELVAGVRGQEDLDALRAA